jgi:coenzyme F420 hydrogenase subunit beta
MSIKIFDKVVDGGYCIGCGLCAAYSPNIEMKWSDLLNYTPVKTGPVGVEEDSLLNQLCPFSGDSLNEDEIGGALYPHGVRDARLGYVSKSYAGYVKEDGFRKNGSSGGMGSWLAVQLLKRGLVDAVVHVGVSSEAENLFGYRISSSEEEIRLNSKSRYYPITLSKILQDMKESKTATRFVFIGIPCYVKSIRLACKQDKVLADRIKFCIGLVCGHMKSGAFAEYLSWQVGIKPSELDYIDFRKKQTRGRANNYAFGAVAKNNPGEEIITPMHEVKGGDWGMGYFKLKACEFCDDVVAETADVVVGDAWLPKYDSDPAGTNLIITRHPIFDEIISEALAADKLCIEEIASRDAIASQKSGFRHRREGLAYRLDQAKKAGVWFPEKRTQPGSKGVDSKRRRVYSLRLQISEKSHHAFLNAKQQDNLDVFDEELHTLIGAYNRASSPSLARKTASLVKKMLFKVIKRR